MPHCLNGGWSRPAQEVGAVLESQCLNCLNEIGAGRGGGVCLLHSQFIEGREAQLHSPLGLVKRFVANTREEEEEGEEGLFKADAVNEDPKRDCATLV